MKSKNKEYIFLCPQCGQEIEKQIRDSSGIGLPTRQYDCQCCGWQGKDADCEIKSAE